MINRKEINELKMLTKPVIKGDRDSLTRAIETIVHNTAQGLHPAWALVAIDTCIDKYLN